MRLSSTRETRLFCGLLEFAERYHVTRAHFVAIGALNKATLGWNDPQRKMYKKIPMNGQREVTAMSGDIALYQGNPLTPTMRLEAKGGPGVSIP
jgi:hypothetical protein